MTNIGASNGLLRQYFPKGTDLSRWSAEEIEAVAHALNTRPRKRSAGGTRQKRSTSTYYRSNKPVLLPPIESSQYTSEQFVQFCHEHGVRNSAGRTGICYDNAAAESFWATMKKELIHLRPFDTIARPRREVFEYIEGYYNTKRTHSALGYLSPAEYEIRSEGLHLNSA